MLNHEFSGFFPFDEVLFFIIFLINWYLINILSFFLAIRITFREIKQHDCWIDEKKGEAWWSAENGEEKGATLVISSAWAAG